MTPPVKMLDFSSQNSLASMASGHVGPGILGVVVHSEHLCQSPCREKEKGLNPIIRMGWGCSWDSEKSNKDDDDDDDDDDDLHFLFLPFLKVFSLFGHVSSLDYDSPNPQPERLTGDSGTCSPQIITFSSPNLRPIYILFCAEFQIHFPHSCYFCTVSLLHSWLPSLQHY